MLRDELLKDRLRSFERAHLERAFAHPWCVPSDPERMARVGELTGTTPRATRPGECAIVTVSDGEARASLYRMAVRDAGDRSDASEGVPLVGAAARALGVARRVVWRHLAALHPTNVLTRRAWSAELITREGEGVDVAIEGPSCGLAIALGLASLFVDRAVPADLIASAVLEPDGRCSPVGGLPRKLDLIAGSALGVRRVFLAEAQRDEGEAWAVSNGAALEIVPVASFARALEIALDWRFTDDDLERLFSDEKARAAAARQLFDLVAGGTTSMPDWSVMERTAQHLADRALSAGEATTATVSTLTATICRRHTGREALIPWPDPAWLEALARPRRLAVIAHVVQSASDCDDDTTRAYVSKARPSLAAVGDATECDWILLGALGRAFAAIGAYREATLDLEAAIAGWDSVGELGRASFALAELVRVTAMLDDHARLASLECDIVARVLSHPETTDVSAGFIELARARAYLLLKDPERAAGILERVDVVEWRLAPPDLARPRLRWLACAYSALGDDARAEATREALDTALGMEDDQLLLARLDAAWPDVERARLLLATLSAHAMVGYEIQRVIARCSARSLSEQARWLLDHYRY